MKRLSIFVALILLGSPAGGSVDIRSVSPQEYPEVSAVVRVLDNHGRPVPGLSRDDFRVSEDGVLAPAVQVRPSFLDGGSVAVVVLIDTSYSMRGAPLEGAKAAAQEFLDRLGPDDRAALITFGRPPLEHGGFGPPGGITSLGGLTAGGYTALYDAVNLGIARLASQKATARAVIVFTDGGDDGSNLSLAGVRQVVNDASIPIHVVAFASPEFNAAPMQDLAAVSHGSYRQTANPTELSALYGQVADELLTEYRITYTSVGGPGQHQLQIEVTTSTLQASAVSNFQVVPATPAVAAPKAPTAPTGGVPLPGLVGAATAVLAAVAGSTLLARRRRRRRVLPAGQETRGRRADLGTAGSTASLTGLVLEGTGISITLGVGPIMVGRDPAAQVIIDDPSVSRHHAKLSVVTDGVWVEDLGSSNGTLVNGVPVQRELMHDGDILDIGDLQLVLRGQRS